MKKNNLLKDDIRIRDPFIYKENGYYYLTGTTGFKRIYGYKSKDLMVFEGPFLLFSASKNNITTECCWAPEIHKINNCYYMFFTMKEKGKCRGCYIAKSNKVFGQYILNNAKPITPSNWECLDATYFHDKNKHYTVFCKEWLQVKNGEIYIAELSDDFKNIISTPKLLFKAKDANWTSPVNKDGYVTDGPFCFKVKNKYKMLWSSFYQNKYALSIIESNYLDKNWKQEEIPFIKNDAGHGMIFKDNNKIFLAIHYTNKYPNERLKIIEIDDDNDYQIY